MSWVLISLGLRSSKLSAGRDYEFAKLSAAANTIMARARHLAASQLNSALAAAASRERPYARAR